MKDQTLPQWLKVSVRKHKGTGLYYFAVQNTGSTMALGTRLYTQRCFAKTAGWKVAKKYHENLLPH